MALHLRAGEAMSPIFRKHTESLLNSGKFSDLTVVCDGQEFNVHKSQFSLACTIQDLAPVRVVTVSNCAPAVLWNIMEFVYFGETQCPAESARPLKKLMQTLGCWESFGPAFYEYSKLLGDDIVDESSNPPLNPQLNNHQPNAPLNPDQNSQEMEAKPHDKITLDFFMEEGDDFKNQELSKTEDGLNSSFLDYDEDEPMVSDSIVGQLMSKKEKKKLKKLLKRKLEAEVKIEPGLEGESGEGVSNFNGNHHLEEDYTRTTHVAINGEQVPVDEVGFACPICYHKFRSIYQLKKHCKAKHPEQWENEIYREWKKLPRSKDRLDPAGHVWLRRFKKVKVEGQYMCQICNVGLVSMLSLRKHTAAFHKDVDPASLKAVDKRPYKCDKCDYSTATANDFKDHLMEHSDYKEEFQCGQCGMVFDRRKKYAEHIRYHHTEPGYMCEKCSKSFKRRHHYMDHLITHTDARPFACEYCTSAFARRSVLKKHILAVHLNERRYACTYCDKAFVTSSVLKNHIDAIHLNIRKFACDECDMRFSCNGNRRKHMWGTHKIKV